MVERSLYVSVFAWVGIVVASLLIAMVLYKVVTSAKVVPESFEAEKEKLDEYSSQTFDFVLPIYVISLPIRKEKRLEPLLKRIKPDPRYAVEEVHAVDGAKDLVETFLTRGQTGCWLSHAYFWKVIAERPEPFALVLEDDAMIYLPDKYPDLVDVVEGAPVGWDVIYLGGQYQPRKDGKDVTTRVSARLVESNREMWYSHAYLITREGAAKYLEQSAEFSDKNTLSSFDNVTPLDVWQTVEERHVQIYNTDPLLVPKADDGVSDTYDKPPAN